MTPLRAPQDLFPRELFSVEWTDRGAAATELCAAERALARNAVPRRRGEFAAGRVCAHRALRRLHLHSDAILRDEHGSPLWPAGARGSISHTRGCVLSVVALDRRVAALGVDVECHAEPLADRVLQQICVAEELARLQALPPAARRLQAYALFSIKEAIYKAVYGATRQRLGFADASVRFDLDRGVFEARLSRDADLGGRRLLTGRVGCNAQHVFTGLWWFQPGAAAPAHLVVPMEQAA